MGHFNDVCSERGGGNISAQPPRRSHGPPMHACRSHGEGHESSTQSQSCHCPRSSPEYAPDIIPLPRGGTQSGPRLDRPSSGLGFPSWLIIRFPSIGARRCELEGSVGWRGAVREDVDSQVHGAAALGCAAGSAVLRAWAGPRGQRVHLALGGASVGSLQDRAHGSAQQCGVIEGLFAVLIF